jgi:hypothetical protein
MLLRTAKSCGPDAPTLASSSRSCVGPTGLRQNISAGDGGKTARSPGRARRKPLKPLRAGMPGDSGVLVVTRVRFTNTKCTRGRGCSGRPAFPTPSFGRKIFARLGRFAPRDREAASWGEDEGCVPRMLRSAPLLRRGALLIRGPWVPALRSSVKNAAPRPGHEARCLTGSRDDGFAFEQR